MVSTFVLIFWYNFIWAYNKNKLYNISDCWSRDMLNFDFFLWKGLVLASASHFVYDFSRKIFLVLYSIDGPNFIFWLPLLLEILDNICIIIICCPVCDVINFEINLSFPIKPFFLCNLKVRTKSYISQEWNELLTWNKKRFSSLLTL